MEGNEVEEPAGPPHMVEFVVRAAVWMQGSLNNGKKMLLWKVARGYKVQQQWKMPETLEHDVILNALHLSPVVSGLWCPSESGIDCKANRTDNAMPLANLCAREDKEMSFFIKY